MVILNWLFEYWLPIRGYEGLYEVSNFGRVRSLDHQVKCRNGKRIVKGCILNPRIGRGGYLTVSLNGYGVKKTMFVHRIVVEAFIQNSRSLPFINHRDENKLNNCVWNLEWCTAKYNTNYGSGLNKMLETRRYNNSSNSEKPVYQYTKNGVFVKMYKSQAEAGRETGVDHRSISLCAKGFRKTAGKYVWREK